MAMGTPSLVSEDRYSILGWRKSDREMAKSSR